MLTSYLLDVGMLPFSVLLVVGSEIDGGICCCGFEEYVNVYCGGLSN